MTTYSLCVHEELTKSIYNLSQNTQFIAAFLPFSSLVTMLTCMCKVDTHFYIVELGCTGVPVYFIFLFLL